MISTSHPESIALPNVANRLSRLQFSHLVRESKTVLDSGFHIVDSRFQVLDSSFLSVELRFWIPTVIVGFRIPQAKTSRIPESGFSSHEVSFCLY